MDISVVIPLYNEEESLPELYAWIERVMQAKGFSFEVIFVNDGSTDRSWQVIETLSRKEDCVKGIKFRRNYGKSPALYCGFKEAQGNVVITMDADLQDSPDEIPELYRMKTDLTSCRVIRRSATTRFQRHFLRNSSTQQHAESAAFAICTTSIAD